MKVTPKRFSTWLSHGNAVQSILPKGPDPRTNMVWDVLGATPLITGRNKMSILMLGAGLGTTLHVSERALALAKREAQYTVVESDVEVVIAMTDRAHFEVDYFIQDAGDFVPGHSERYDVVIEDTFVKFEKPGWVDEKLELAMALVIPKGLFVMNMMSRQLPNYQNRIEKMFEACVEVTLRGYPNSIVIATNDINTFGLRHVALSAIRYVAKPEFFSTIDVKGLIR